MKMPNKTFYLVIYDEKMAKGLAGAMPSVIDEEQFNVLAQDANPIIYRNKGKRKFQVTEKRMFNYRNADGSETVFIVCDCARLKIEQK